ncbi:MAG TPA: hypothetical protein VKU37_11270, partial [Verrucomicrobiae bacterium]|nr:hypothetical protein [Verrucomicrobiae bacterium]
GDGTNAAVFQMVNNGTHSFSSGLVVSNNGVLTGLGTVAGNISINGGGTIAPGTGNIGTIVATGSLTLNTGSTAFMKLNALGGTADSITGVSNLVFGGTLQLSNLAGTFSAGNSFKLFDATNYNGAFGGLSPSSPAAGLRWNTNELGVDGVLRVFSSTPQPPSFASVTVANGNLVVSGVGGNPYDPCYLLTSTNLSAPVSGWTCVATNTFDLSGAVSFTNPITAGQAQYYRLQVN